MAIQLPITKVWDPRHLRAWVKQNNPNRTDVLMEVYTGYVLVGFREEQGGTKQKEYVSYLCSGPASVLAYVANSIIDWTLTVAPSNMVEQEDETLLSVDQAWLDLAPQSLTNVGGKPNCLVLRTKVSAGHATLSAITYQATILSLGQVDPDHPKPLLVKEKDLPTSSKDEGPLFKM